MKNFKNAVYVICFAFCFGIVGSLDCDRITMSEAVSFISAACAVSLAVFLADKLIRLLKVLLYRLAKAIIRYRKRKHFSEKGYGSAGGMRVKA